MLKQASESVVDIFSLLLLLLLLLLLFIIIIIVLCICLPIKTMLTYHMVLVYQPLHTIVTFIFIILFL